MTQTTPNQMNRLKEVKVQLPLHLHLRLHRLKLLEGRQLSTTVRDALEAFFADRPDVAAELDLALDAPLPVKQPAE